MPLRQCFSCREAGLQKPPAHAIHYAMKLYIKNMVCNRCIMAVRSLLAGYGIEPLAIELGEVTLAQPLSPQLRRAVGDGLSRLGFELIDDRRHRLAEQVRIAVIELAHYAGSAPRVNLSDYISQKLGMDYDAAAELFSAIHGITVEKFYIAQKIEHVKELLVYDELSLGEIACSMGYSSVAHLSAQFKRVTGITPTQFRKQHPRRRPIDEI